MREYSEVVVIGAGASGLLCAGLLARAGLSVLLLEKNNRIGKKLSATGNGRCNFTNRNMDVFHYYGDSSWLQEVLTEKTAAYVISLFRELGVYPRERDGYVYPHTNQAGTVVEALQRLCIENNCEIVTECKVTSVHKEREGKFGITTSLGRVCSRFVVLATGGKAGAELGGDGNGYKLARSLGHSVTPVYPGLTGLFCGGNWWKQVAGTRVQGRFSLVVNGERREGEAGEIQITRDGVSGIPVFQLCRVAAEALRHADAPSEVWGEIDFVPDMEPKELEQWVERFGIAGLVPKKWVPVLEEKSNRLKEFRFPIRDTYGIERAQVTAGGIPLFEVESKSMQSKIVPGLYVTGELLDVDGRCGGYNLHFAWSSAILAAEAIIEERN